MAWEEQRWGRERSLTVSSPLAISQDCWEHVMVIAECQAQCVPWTDMKVTPELCSRPCVAGACPGGLTGDITPCFRSWLGLPGGVHASQLSVILMRSSLLPFGCFYFVCYLFGFYEKCSLHKNSHCNERFNFEGGTGFTKSA